MGDTLATDGHLYRAVITLRGVTMRNLRNHAVRLVGICALSLAGLTPGHLLGQAATASISGRVTDASGAAAQGLVVSFLRSRHSPPEDNPPSQSMSWISYSVGRFSGVRRWPVLGVHRGRRLADPRGCTQLPVFGVPPMILGTLVTVLLGVATAAADVHVKRATPA